MKIKRILILFQIISLCVVCMVITSCSGESVKKGTLILTEAPVNIQSPDYISGALWRYLPGSRISAFMPGKPGSLIVLTKNFYSACFPEISYDGRFMLFTAQQNEGDSWQIWEMNLANLKSRKITSFKENCTDPVYLPGGRIVFSKLTVNDTVKSAHCLYTCNLNGSDTRQLTFSPNANFATTVLKDGRLLTVSTQLMPDQGEPLLMVMRPDGTKADMFCRGDHGSKLITGANETNDGKIIFIESREGSRLKGDLVSVSYNRPLHTRINLTADINGDFQFALPLRPDKYLVSCRNSDSEHFSLYEFDPQTKTLGQMVFSDPGFNTIDVVVAEKYERPKKLPSEVDMKVKTGLLLCQDINVIGIGSSSDKPGSGNASMIEVLGIDTTYGIVPVEKDGSFYLKVVADTPFQIKALDEKGRTLNGPCSWLWVRPNERRGCVGCHEDPELVPENRIPNAVKNSPVIIPVHITEIKEKTVELE